VILPPEELKSYALSLPAKERLVSLIALKLAFPILDSDKEWRAHIRAARSELKPNQREYQAIVERAIRVSADLGKAKRGEAA
jgi:fructose-1-phosphate kinase PfkB-like protein